MMTLAEGVDLLNFIHVHPMVLKLFPYSGETLPLPFLRSIDDASGDEMAGTLDLLIQSPKVLYKDY
jgi:hypothetical protein